MSVLDCEKVRLSVMAERDGERAPLERGEVERHLASCMECRAEVAFDLDARAALEALGRRLPEVEPIWPSVEVRLRASSARRALGWAAALAIVAARFATLGLDLGWAGQLAPLAAAVLVLVAFGVNPLRLSPAEPGASPRTQAPQPRPG